VLFGHKNCSIKGARVQNPKFCSGQSELCVFPEVLIRFGVTAM
jgi:hypothetical protein